MEIHGEMAELASISAKRIAADALRADRQALLERLGQKSDDWPETINILDKIDAINQKLEQSGQ